jgi:predicted 2-oxoglutarate/Fe(II)-dependent dioxygenase YbiX
MMRVQSSHSFVLSLNGPPTAESPEGFEGGGTYFHAIQKVICPGAGHMLSFAGGRSLHGGAPVSRGVRYILAVFLFITTSATSSVVKRVISLEDREEVASPPILVVNPPKKKHRIDFGKDGGSVGHSFSFKF